jgi:hypothetical protein
MSGADNQTSDTVQYLDDAINALLLTWSVTAKQDGMSGSSVTLPADSQIRVKARSVLDKMFAANSGAVVGSVVQVWAAHSPDIAVCSDVHPCADRVQDEAIFDCIDTLAPSAQKVVEIISEAVTGRGGRASETSSAIPIHFEVNELTVQIRSGIDGIPGSLYLPTGSAYRPSNLEHPIRFRSKYHLNVESIYQSSTLPRPTMRHDTL